MQEFSLRAIFSIRFAVLEISISVDHMHTVSDQTKEQTILEVAVLIRLTLKSKDKILGTALSLAKCTFNRNTSQEH